MLASAKKIQPVETNEEESSINIDSFKVDIICAKCGTWRSDHDYAVCTEPHWLDENHPATT